MSADDKLPVVPQAQAAAGNQASPPRTWVQIIAVLTSLRPRSSCTVQISRCSSMGWLLRLTKKDFGCILSPSSDLHRNQITH